MDDNDPSKNTVLLNFRCLGNDVDTVWRQLKRSDPTELAIYCIQAADFAAKSPESTAFSNLASN